MTQSAFENLAEVFNAATILIVIPVASLIVAFSVAIIAFQNHLVQKENLKEKLFERRYKVVATARRLVFAKFQDDQEEFIEARRAFMNCYEQSEYLFSKQFQERFGDLMLTISQLKRVEDRIMRRGHNMNETDWQQISSKADDLDQQMTVYLDLLNEMSRPFLSFRY